MPRWAVSCPSASELCIAVLFQSQSDGKDVISGSRGAEYEDYTLLGYCAAQSRRMCPTFQRCSLPYSVFLLFHLFVTEFIYQYRKNWKEHVDRIPKMILKYQPKGKRNLGRPLKRWKDSVL
jgi:hypothetical protein